MGALPKRKISHARKNKRRAHHALVVPELTVCPNCKRAMQQHHACAFCGKYKGKTIVAGQL